MNSLTSASVANPVYCPLCGLANQCAEALARATGEPQPACWCMAQPIPAAVLARIPATSRGLACVCQRCASQVIAAVQTG